MYLHKLYHLRPLKAIAWYIHDAVKPSPPPGSRAFSPSRRKPVRVAPCYPLSWPPAVSHLFSVSRSVPVVDRLCR